MPISKTPCSAGGVCAPEAGHSGASDRRPTWLWPSLMGVHLVQGGCRGDGQAGTVLRTKQGSKRGGLGNVSAALSRAGAVGCVSCRVGVLLSA